MLFDDQTNKKLVGKETPQKKERNIFESNHMFIIIIIIDVRI